MNTGDYSIYFLDSKPLNMLSLFLTWFTIIVLAKVRMEADGILPTYLRGLCSKNLSNLTAYQFSLLKHITMLNHFEKSGLFNFYVLHTFRELNCSFVPRMLPSFLIYNLVWVEITFLLFPFLFDGLRLERIACSEFHLSSWQLSCVKCL